jgi:mannosidase alpha-like ER degradation enhancer 2
VVADGSWASLADSVRDQLVHAWGGYLRYAKGHDELRPLSDSARDWYEGGSLLMTPVDAFDTMLLVGLTADADTAKALILRGLSFDRDQRVQVFEITIRLLGGLLSAYQMDGDPRFLALATDLGHRLLPAFHSPTGMPYRFVNLRSGELSGPVSNPAEIGTLMLEFGTLSKLTGDTTYYHDAKRAVTALYDRRSKIGLVGSAIDVRTGEWKNGDSHISGGIDSYYEYLLKGWLLFGDQDFLRMWSSSVSAANRYLADRGPTGAWYGHADMRTGRRGATQFGALDAFFPGTLTLGSEALRADSMPILADTLLGRAVPLMASVDTMWERWGIEPEVMNYGTMEVVHPGYELRPEALESAFYLWRATGDVRYREMGRRMFEAIVERCRTDAGFAALEDVRTGKRVDRMPSYFLAETLKYAWLLFSPDSALRLRTWAGMDRVVGGDSPGAAGTSAAARDTLAVVFNTEAHPLRRTWR